MSKVYKLRTDEVEEVKEALMKLVVNKETIMKETDVLHALIKYHLKDLTADEVLRYRSEVLKKDD